MKTKFAVLISAALTVFLTLVAGGIVMGVNAYRNAEAATAPQAAAAPTAEPAPTQAPAPTAALDPAREQAYRNLIDQANQRLAQDQKQIQDLQNQVQAQTAAQPPAAAAAQPAVQPGQITSKQASVIASGALGSTDVLEVQRAMIGAREVYIVTFKSGAMVAVGLNGQVLAVWDVNTSPAGGGGGGGGRGGSGGGGGGGEGGHEGGDD